MNSSLCTRESLYSPELLAWADRTRAAWDEEHTGTPVLTHRKLWEWFAIAQAAAERGVLVPGSRGLGFGVGQDPLAALFADAGCELVATDLGAEDSTGGWSETGQHAAALGDLNTAGICDDETFRRRVTFRPQDMRRIAPDLTGFDFTWSACALEHLGSLEAGLRFLLRQLDCLRPGGYAFHTTEFNVSSDRATVGVGGTVLYRRRDVERLVAELHRLGHRCEVDFSLGSTPDDRHVDQPPWSGPHLKIQLGRYVATSLLLVVRKGDGGGAPWSPSPAWRLRAAGQQVRFRGSSLATAGAERLVRVRNGVLRRAPDRGP